MIILFRYEEIGEAGCPRKLLKIQFFWAFAYFHLEAVHKPQKIWALDCLTQPVTDGWAAIMR